jgi:hypothetical protein
MSVSYIIECDGDASTKKTFHNFLRSSLMTPLLERLIFTMRTLPVQTQLETGVMKDV